MSTRARLRKERKEIAEAQIKEELKQKYFEQTAGIRQIFKWIGWGASAVAVLALTIYLVVLGIKSIPQFAVVSGPFGEIKQTELEASKFATLYTDQGAIKIALDVENTPKTAANFVLLSRDKFYEGTLFHRVLKGFMIQGGDPNSKNEDPADDGTGGPGYSFPDEPIKGEYKRGVVAMANSGKNTNGSQFFIVHADSQLPPNYVIFGQVVEGMDVVDKIAETPVEDNGHDEISRPTEPRVIQRVEISKE